VTGGLPDNNRSRVGEVFRVFLRLGVTAFGGPVAHLAFFHDEFVKRRRWLDEPAFADLVALCQFLPGPASSQFGFAVGLQRAGWPGALAAWAGFTLPAASVMILLALGAAKLGGLAASGWLHGLKLATVAVVAQAVWTMGSRLCRGWVRLLLAMVTTILVLVWPAAGVELVALGLAALAGRWLLQADPSDVARTATVGLPRRRALAPLLAFFGLLVVLPTLAAAHPGGWLQQFDRFYRAGALVFGGGHVVLPFLQSAVVAPGLVTPDEFLAGYGLAQALPGPLFAFAAYLGAVSHQPPNGWLGGVCCLLAVFLPGLLLVAAALPWWEQLRRSPSLRAALHGANAAVVGILLAALIAPIATGTLRRPADWCVAGLAFAGLQWVKLPAWTIVTLCAAAGWLLGS
jgi:chromate transporter